MRWLRFSVLVLLVTILQKSLVDIIAVTGAGIKPDLLLILLAFSATHFNSTEAVIASFAIGFAADIVCSTQGLMGPQILSFGLIGTLLSDLHRVVSIRKMPHQSLAILITGFLTALLAHLLTFLKASSATSNIYVEAIWKPLYSAVVGPFLFLPAGWWMRITKRRSRRR